MRAIVRFFRRESGATAVEYAVSLALIFLALGAVLRLNDGTSRAFRNSSGQIGTYGTTTAPLGS